MWRGEGAYRAFLLKRWPELSTRRESGKSVRACILCVLDRWRSRALNATVTVDPDALLYNSVACFSPRTCSRTSKGPQSHATDNEGSIVQTAALLIEVVRWWSIAGGVVAAAFLTIGIDRIEANARGAYIFRVLLIPGVLLLWPLVLWRWAVLEAGRDEWQKRHAPPRRAHRRVWAVLAVAIPVLLVAALAMNQHWPADYAPEKIGEASR